MLAPDWTRAPLLSTTPAVILPVPSAVKEPTAARKLDSAVYPLRLKAYCPLRSDSLPESAQAAVAAVIVTLTEADLVLSATLATVTLNVAGDGTAAGASYVTDKPEPAMVPYVALPLVMPFTVQVTAVLDVLATAAVIAKVPFTTTLCVKLVGLTMETATGEQP